MLAVVSDEGYLLLSEAELMAGEAVLDYVRHSVPGLRLNVLYGRWEFPEVAWLRIYAACVEALGFDQVTLVRNGRQLLLI